MDKKQHPTDSSQQIADDKKLVRTRHLVHVGFSILMFLVIIIFNSLNDKSVVTIVKVVSLWSTLGLYAFGLFMKSKTVHD